MKGNDSFRVLILSAASLLHLALMPLALSATIGRGAMIRNQISPTSSPLPAIPSPLHDVYDGHWNMGKIAEGGPHPPLQLHPVRHIRSVDHQQPQEQPLQRGRNGLLDLQQDDNNSIQSNSESEEETPEGVHKAQKSFVSSDMFPENVVRMQSAPKGALVGGHKWLFRGMGQSSQQFPRGLRRDSHFIRFGRNSNLDFDGFNLASAGSSNNGNKKNNFIRLGRENPRRNNFIRLGRSGLWGSNERFGSKVGYFPDYYSQLVQGNPNVIWDFEGQQPVPFDPSEVVMQG